MKNRNHLNLRNQAVPGSAKKRMVRKGSASIAEQGSIEELGGNPPAASDGTPQVKSPVKAGPTPKEPAVSERKQWSEFPDDPPESFNTAVPDTIPMTESAPASAPEPQLPSAATVTVQKSRSSSAKPFLLKDNETNDWPNKQPKVRLPVWNSREAFLEKFLTKKGCNCTLSNRLREINHTPGISSDATPSKCWTSLLYPN